MGWRWEEEVRATPPTTSAPGQSWMGPRRESFFTGDDRIMVLPVSLGCHRGSCRQNQGREVAEAAGTHRAGRGGEGVGTGQGQLPLRVSPKLRLATHGGEGGGASREPEPDGRRSANGRLNSGPAAAGKRSVLRPGTRGAP